MSFNILRDAIPLICRPPKMSCRQGNTAWMPAKRMGAAYLRQRQGQRQGQFVVVVVYLFKRSASLFCALWMLHVPQRMLPSYPPRRDPARPGQTQPVQGEAAQRT